MKAGIVLNLDKSLRKPVYGNWQKRKEQLKAAKVFTQFN